MKTFFLILVVASCANAWVIAATRSNCISKTSIAHPNPCSIDVKHSATGAPFTNVPSTLPPDYQKLSSLLKERGITKKTRKKPTDYNKTYYYSKLSR